MMVEGPSKSGSATPESFVRQALSDLASFSALAPADRLAVAEAVAAQLGPAFRAAGSLVGAAQLAAVVHVPTSEVFVLIPGGVFPMGFSEADYAAFTAYFPVDEHAALHRALGDTAKLMRPVREVRVGPFAIAQRPLQNEESLKYFGGALRAEPFSRAEADAVIATTGFRYPSEAEWEYVAREGGGLSFLGDVAAVYFDCAAPDDETGWGIARMGQAVWVGDRWHKGYKGAPTDGTAWTQGRGLPMHRGSFSGGLDAMQDSHELVYALTALRQEPGIDDGTDEEVWLRLAFGPDADGRWALAAPVAPSRKKAPAKPRATKAASAAPTVPPAAPSEASADDLVAEVMGDDWVDKVLAEPDEARAGALAAVALQHRAYPDLGEASPLAEELPAHLLDALWTLFEARPALPLPEIHAPSDPDVRRRWLGLAPPGDLETPVTWKIGAKTFSGPFWRAIERLQDAGKAEALFSLMPAAPTVRALVELALTGGYDYHRPEVTWPLIIAAGLENVAWARTTLPRVLASTKFSVRSIAHYAVVYPLALAGDVVEPSWTTGLNLVAPPESVVVWNGLRPDQREAAMVAAIRRVLAETSVLNDTLFFVRRYKLPALAEACLAYFTSKEGAKKHGRKTMSNWVYLLRKLCGEVPALAAVLPQFPAE